MAARRAPLPMGGKPPHPTLRQFSRVEQALVLADSITICHAGYVIGDNARLARRAPTPALFPDLILILGWQKARILHEGVEQCLHY